MAAASGSAARTFTPDLPTPDLHRARHRTADAPERILLGAPAVRSLVDAQELTEDLDTEDLDTEDLDTEDLGTTAPADRAVLTAEQEEPTDLLDDVLFTEEEEEEQDAALDDLLARRTAAEPQLEEEDRGERAPGAMLRWPDWTEGAPVTVARRRPDEFVCSGCFLLKRKELVADAGRGLCRDCAG